MVDMGLNVFSTPSISTNPNFKGRICRWNASYKFNSHKSSRISWRDSRDRIKIVFKYFSDPEYTYLRAFLIRANRYIRENESLFVIK